MQFVIVIVVIIALVISSAANRRKREQAKEAEEKRRAEIARAQQQEQTDEMTEPAVTERKPVPVQPVRESSDPRFPDWEPPVVPKAVPRAADPRFPDLERPNKVPEEECDAHTPLPQPGSIARSEVRPEGPAPHKKMVAVSQTVNERLVAAGEKDKIHPKNHVATPSVRTPFAPPPKHHEEETKRTEDTPEVDFVPKFNGNAIVQGIIYSEILAKPKALRRG